MNKLIIKNIGAIKHIEIDINRINVFIGPQSSGKSTIAKILCYCQWVEKDCFLNNDRQRDYEKPNRFYDSLVSYHRLEGYFNRGARIEYEGEYLKLIYCHKSKKTRIKEIKDSTYNYPKISYIPSERNMVTAVDNFSSNSDSLFYFKNDWIEARDILDKISMSNVLDRKVSFEYDKDRDKNYIYDGDNKLPLLNASSGILSLTPLYLLISYMYDKIYKSEKNSSKSKQGVKAELVSILDRLREALHSTEFNASNYKEEIKTFKAIYLNLNKEGDISFAKSNKDTAEKKVLNTSSEINDLFNYKHTKLFIEEPEQNLFPKAQKKFIYELLRLINTSDRKHSAVITTHSPYILYALNNCIMGGLVGDKMQEEEKEELDSFKSNAWINPNEVSLWQINSGELVSIENKTTGTIGNHYFNEITAEAMSEYYEMLNYLDNEE